MHLPPHFTQRYGPWALVTGASSGIGAEFARQLAAAGFNIVLTARRVDRLQSLSHQLLNDFPIQTRVISADLSTPDGCNTIHHQTQDLSIRLLIANAGFETHGSFFRSSINSYLDMISVNCTAVTMLVHSFGRKMVDAGQGGIILVSSIAAVPTPWWATYGATKAFVSSLGISLRDELQPLGVDVMVLEPGLVDTEMSAKVGTTINFRKMGLVKQPASECVSQALQGFVAGQARTTPGLLNHIFFFILKILPTSWSMQVLRWSHAVAMDQDLTRFT